jgi:hypothetical protein
VIVPSRVSVRGKAVPAFQIDERFAEEVGKRKWSVTVKGYLQGYVNGKMTTLGRYVWLLHTGDWPKQTIDHINRDPLDNRIDNLRDVSRSENNKNRTPLCLLGKKNKKKSQMPTGVVLRRNHKCRPYSAMVYTNGKTKHLGYYPTPDEASAAYQREVAAMRAASTKS